MIDKEIILDIEMFVKSLCSYRIEDTPTDLGRSRSPCMYCSKGQGQTEPLSGMQYSQYYFYLNIHNIELRYILISCWKYSSFRSTGHIPDAKAPPVTRIKQ